MGSDFHEPISAARDRPLPHTREGQQDAALEELQAGVDALRSVPDLQPLLDDLDRRITVLEREAR
jgi:hypothetical protein